MIGAGPERLFRLATQPRRLCKRYLKHTPGFVALLTLRLSGLRHFTPETRT